MNFKSLIIVASVLIVFVIASGCTGSTSPATEPSITDCGTQPMASYENDTCIRAALQACTPAKLVGESFGLESTLMIQGVESDLCVLEYTTVFEANPAKGIAEDRITKAVCKYPAEVYEVGEFPVDTAIINAHCVDL